MTARSYSVRRNGETLALYVADDPAEAAALWARDAFGARATVRRTTGTVGLSGYFVAYELDRRHQAYNSISEPVHVGTTTAWDRATMRQEVSP